MIEVHPISASIDSDLGSLADALEVVLVERDSESPLTPTAQSWRALDQGDLIRVRLGLAGLGYDDYGVFRVDECTLDGDERSWRQRIRARDKAALLCDEKGQETFGFRAYGAQATEASNPTAWYIAELIAARVGLSLVWEAPNYTLKEFVFNADESASSALSRLLEPLRQSRRYRADAWVESEAGLLIVRRRGNGANVGTIDCSLGRATVSRARQPQVGDIDVYGATYTYLTVFESGREQVLSTGTTQEGGEPTASVRVIEDSPTHRVTETGKVEGGVFAVVSRTTENLTYEDVNDGDRWLGRILRKTTVEEETNLNAQYPKRVITTTSYGYDSQWRLVLRDEGKKQRDQVTGEPSIFLERTITSYEQLTPTDIRTKTLKLKENGEQIGKAEYQQSPGTLQSALHQNPSLADAQWKTNPDGTQPEQVKGQEFTDVYHGQADGGGTLPRVYRNENLNEAAICELIADDLAAESGKWLYTVRLIWPRPFSYRKGQKVTLTNLPGGCPELSDAVITRLQTRFDAEAAEWVHEVELEAWRES